MLSKTVSKLQKCLRIQLILLSKLICDADLHHLACSDYAKMAEKMHKEIEKVKNQEIDGETWNQMNYDSFKDHEFFTLHAQNKLQPIKNQNLDSLKKLIKKKKKEAKYVEELEKR